MRTTVTTCFILISIITYGQGPDYANQETKEVIQKMINAHGGYEKWAEAKTFSFDNIMFSDQLPGMPYWINQVTIDQKTRAVYQDWPLHDAYFAYDGKEAWAVNWKIGNPPKFEALFFYYFLNLPWITQDSNVKLGEVAKKEHSAWGREVLMVDMGFKEKPAVGKTVKDTYKLFIDPDSYQLLGYEYSIGYGHMLDLFRFPEGAELFGPMFRINDSYTEVDGLLYPNRMHTMNTEQTQTFGHHAIINYSLDKPFDKKRLERPENAQTDTSSDKRKSG